MDELSVGVIGCGGHARSHFEMIAAEPRVRLVAIAELDDERRAEVAQLRSVPAMPTTAGCSISTTSISSTL